MYRNVPIRDAFFHNIISDNLLRRAGERSWMQAHSVLGYINLLSCILN